MCVFPITPKNRPNYRIPSILRVPNGDLLIFAEKRNDGIGDVGNHDIVLKRSSDQGRTWSAEQVVFDDDDRTCTDITVGLDRSNGKIWLFFLRDKKKFVYLTSIDSGRSWQGPVSVHEQVTKPEWDKLTGKSDDDADADRQPHGDVGKRLGATLRHRSGQCDRAAPDRAAKPGGSSCPARHREDTGNGRLRSFSHTVLQRRPRRNLDARRHRRTAHQRMPARRIG